MHVFQVAAFEMSEVCQDYMYFSVARKEGVWPHTLRQNFMRDTDHPYDQRVVHDS